MVRIHVYRHDQRQAKQHTGKAEKKLGSIEGVFEKSVSNKGSCLHKRGAKSRKLTNGECCLSQLYSAEILAQIARYGRATSARSDLSFTRWQAGAEATLNPNMSTVHLFLRFSSWRRPWFHRAGIT